MHHRPSNEAGEKGDPQDPSMPCDLHRNQWLTDPPWGNCWSSDEPVSRGLADTHIVVSTLLTPLRMSSLTLMWISEIAVPLYPMSTWSHPTTGTWELYDGLHLHKETMKILAKTLKAEDWKPWIDEIYKRCWCWCQNDLLTHSPPGYDEVFYKIKKHMQGQNIRQDLWNSSFRNCLLPGPGTTGGLNGI